MWAIQNHKVWTSNFIKLNESELCFWFVLLMLIVIFLSRHFNNFLLKSPINEVPSFLKFFFSFFQDRWTHRLYVSSSTNFSWLYHWRPLSCSNSYWKLNIPFLPLVTYTGEKNGNGKYKKKPRMYHYSQKTLTATKNCCGKFWFSL